MKIPLKKHIGSLLLCALSTAHFTGSAQTVLFEDNFDSGSLAAWRIVSGALAGPTNDYTAEIVDYSTIQYRIIYDDVRGPVYNKFITAAPNSAGTTKGVKLTVNKNDTAGNVTGVNLYPIGQTFSNNYALRFDMFASYHIVGTGSSELATMGINHSGTRANFASTLAPNTNFPGDGVWYAVVGDGDFAASGDFRAYLANPATNGPNFKLPNTADSGFLDRDGNGVVEVSCGHNPLDPFAPIFPVPPSERWGAPSKHWVQGEVRQQNGVITWLFNGCVISQRTNSSAFTNGTVMIGYMDSLSDYVADPNFVIFDNVRVVDLGTNSAPPVVTIDPKIADVSEPSGSTAVTITRSGNINLPLTVNLRFRGSASNGADCVALPASVTFPPGLASSNLTIQVIDDVKGEPSESLIIDLLGSSNGDYFLYTNFSTTVNIADDGDLPVIGLTTRKATAYEAWRAGRFSVDLSNPTANSLNIPLTITGTATNGVHYTNIPASVTVNSGGTSAIIDILPINNNVMDGTRTVTVTVNPGSGYTLDTVTNGTVSIKDDDLPPGSGFVFADSFETDTRNNWRINSNSADDSAEFAYDYSSTDGIPTAPRSTNTTLGLKLRANMTLNTFSGISLSPKNLNLTGDYRLRFDMWINYNGDPDAPNPLENGGAGSTEFVSAGVGTSGDHPNWDSHSNNVDGIWFAVTGDGFGDAYRAFVGPTMLTAASGVYAAGSQNRSSPLYADFGGDPAPDAQSGPYPLQQGGTSAPGNAGFAWHDVVITRQGNTVKWSMDGVTLATVVASNLLSTNIFIGYFDSAHTNSSPEGLFSFGVIDNLRIETLAPQTPPDIAEIRLTGPTSQTVEIDFSGTASDTIASFTLQSAGVVTGPYGDAAGTITSLGGGNFRASIAVNGSARFYRIRR